MADGTVRIERMQPEDLEAVLRVEVASFSQPWTRDMFETELIPGVSLALVARSDEDILLGYLCGSIIGDEFYISNIAVDPHVRRRGVGKQLLLSALVEASQHGARTASLEVRASNVAAQSLYQHFGFTVVGRRRRYYTGPVEDAVIMFLDRLETAVTLHSEQRG
ncbi:MAG: ribosomal protein S18-alanine N-acetyltransferase [Candidatus Methylomirabilales bacterium]